MIPVIPRKSVNAWLKYFRWDYTVPIWFEETDGGTIYPPSRSVLQTQHDGDLRWSNFPLKEFLAKVEEASARKRRHSIIAYEVPFTVPKSYSLGALGNGLNTDLIELMERAIDVALIAISPALVTRKHGAKRDVKVEAFRFRHPLNRWAEPHLHDHILLWANPVGCDTALHGALLKYLQKTLREIFEYELLRGLRKLQIGVRFSGAPRTLHWELEGFESDLIAAYSERAKGVGRSRKAVSENKGHPENELPKISWQMAKQLWRQDGRPQIPDTRLATHTPEVGINIPELEDLFGKWRSRSTLQLLGCLAGQNLGCPAPLEKLKAELGRLVTASVSSKAIAYDDHGRLVRAIKIQQAQGSAKLRPSKKNAPLIWPRHGGNLEIAVARGNISGRSKYFLEKARHLDLEHDCILAPADMSDLEYESLADLVALSIFRKKTRTLDLWVDRVIPVSPIVNPSEIQGSYLLALKGASDFRSGHSWRVEEANEESLRIVRGTRGRSITWGRIKDNGDNLIFVASTIRKLIPKCPCVVQRSRSCSGQQITEGEVVVPVAMQGSSIQLEDGRQLLPGMRLIEPLYWTRTVPKSAVETLITSEPSLTEFDSWIRQIRCNRLLLLSTRARELRKKIEELADAKREEIRRRSMPPKYPGHAPAGAFSAPKTIRGMVGSTTSKDLCQSNAKKTNSARSLQKTLGQPQDTPAIVNEKSKPQKEGKPLRSSTSGITLNRQSTDDTDRGPEP